MSLVMVSVPAIFAGGVTLFGSDFATWVKSAMGCLLSASFLAFGILMLDRGFRDKGISTGWFLHAFAIAAIFVVVLTRGAPHNNPLLSAAFESVGVAAVIGVTLATIALGGVSAWYLGRGSRSWDLDDLCQRCFGPAVTILCLFAVFGAAEPVLVAWDQPSWSDASNYDRIAHAIALGELPAGRSDYMPIYQFGSAALYWIFGHFFFVPQIANLVLAALTVLFIALAAKSLFSSAGAGLVAALLASSHDYLRYTPNMMTIENWYLPAVALALYCAVRFLASPSDRKAVLLALALGLVFGIRLQGAFFCAFLVLTPLFASQLPVRARLRYCIVAGLTFAATLTPWTIRNMVQDGRISPGTTQAGGQMVYTTDRRPFFGIRREFGTAEIRREWVTKYPDLEERKAAISRHGWLLPLTDPKLVWLEAVPWRALAFYGLLPPGVWDNAGVRSTNWRTEGFEYALQVGPVSMLLLASLIGIVFVRPRRLILFLLGAIAANMVIIVFAGFSEPRVSYPVFPIHMLLAAAPFGMLGGWRENASSASIENGASWRPAFAAFMSIIVIVGIALACRAMFGSAYAYRPIMAETIVNPSRGIDQTITDLTCDSRPAGKPSKEGDFRVAPKPVRMRVVLTNYHFPVKYYGIASSDSGTALGGYPKFASSASQPVYFETRLAPGSCPAQTGRKDKVVVVGLALEGAVANQLLRERDLVEFEGILQGERVNERLHWYWITARSVSVVESAVRQK